MIRLAGVIAVAVDVAVEDNHGALQKTCGCWM